MMFPERSRAKPRRGLPVLPLAMVLLAAALGSGCQTADKADPNSTLTTAGDFQQLAGCYADSQNAPASRPATGADGARTVSVTTSEASSSAADTLGDDTKATQEALSGVGAASYRVTFRELPDNRTQVSGTALGAATQPFTWFETVLPALRNCTGNPDLG